MRRRRNSVVNMTTLSITIFLVLIGAAQLCEGARQAQRRKDTISRTPYLPSPSVETLKELAEAMGAAGFEHYTEGKALVKRLIPENSEPDLDEISHQGVIGKAGVDFPAFPNIPPTGFNCKNVPTGYYADLETDCQVFHICDTSRKISFLCPNGTIFSQSHLICDWWFKVDCASAPALYESSAEYYSNEQKKTHKVTQSLSKNSDLQQITDASNIKENTQPIRRVPLNPTTTERLSRHRQRLQNIQTTNVPPLTNVRATARSHYTAYTDNIFSPTQRTQVTTNNVDKRRKNLVQLIGNNFGNTPTTRTTLPTYTDSSTYRNSGDFNGLKEMQVAAESASFTNNNNRQYLQDYNHKNYRPFPVYNPEVNSRVGRTKSPHSTLTTLFVHDIRDKLFGNQGTNSYDFTTKRPTLLPYTKSYGNLVNEKQEPYTRPGVHLLKDFLDKEKNKTAHVTEKIVKVTERVDQLHAKPFESVTKIPTTRSAEYFTQTASSDRFDVFSTNYNQYTTEPTYHERRERLIKKLNLDTVQSTESTNNEKQFGKRPGLIVPPSLTPKTLHTLAIYYATALDNLSTTTPPLDEEGTTTDTEQLYEIDDRIPALFSEITRNRYNNLFGQENTDKYQEIIFDANSTNEIGDDLSVQQSQNPLSTSPQIRELAQVFTHALSAYLQDPVQFRKALSDIRPTHPTFGDMMTTTDENIFNTETTTTVNEDDEEILGFSDDNKIKPGLAQLRDAKSLNLATVQPRIAETETVTTPETYTTEFLRSSTTRAPFRCCGRISASYTSAATPNYSSTTPKTYINTFASRLIIPTDDNDTYITTTENSYTLPKYGGFQNNSNSSPYGKDVKPVNSKPINNYSPPANIPQNWGLDPVKENWSVSTTPAQITKQWDNGSDSVELENDEELQRAHSQSFYTPRTDRAPTLYEDALVNDAWRNTAPSENYNKITTLRPSSETTTTTVEEEETTTPQTEKPISLYSDIFVNQYTTVKKPAEDLEAPTEDDNDITTVSLTTTPIPTTTNQDDKEDLTTPTSLKYTSSDRDKTTNQFQWSNNFENWHSTVILDPITLNDGLSATGPQALGVSQLASQTTYPNTATTTTDYPGPVYTSTGQVADEQAFSSSQNIDVTTPASKFDSEKRSGRLLKTTQSPIDLTTIEDTVVEKAKEIMNATTTEKLMNVMMKTKSKTVRRLILLLVQTCDDDHNSTAEASKKALLEALMAVSQKDMDEVAKEELEDLTTISPDFENNRFTNTHRRMDKLIDTNFRTRQRNSQRSGKSLNVDPSAINALTNPSTTEAVSPDVKIETTTANTTPSPFTRTTPTSKRGVRKFLVRTTSVDNKNDIRNTNVAKDSPKFEARQASPEQKTPSDTRAIELLKSLYTIAARWG